MICTLYLYTTQAFKEIRIDSNELRFCLFAFFTYNTHIIYIQHQQNAFKISLKCDARYECDIWNDMCQVGNKLINQSA